jgi:hypothetical protein
MTKPIIQLEGNANGNDLIITDTHGCKPLLEDLCRNEKIGENNRLFIAGDLTDRGRL